ncbi:hypothetical protein [Roseivirga misakiensis]|uniref:Uncharacterized protein n=1 Tax=Roseivirga misakiensis TaxID=1563681 RepID=A0A1E5T0X2_9BACT|nr:hypothetical protein [Roseivirga misakiensis]OEK05011.1 hypothetical protein BFP71_16450 [Roseivirga misakiensis]
MISENEHNEINGFLRNVGAEHIEVYQELYDHVATSFEQRAITTQDIKTHIREVVQPNLGGTLGIKKIITARTKAFNKEVYGRAWDIFKDYFIGWPSVLISILTVAIVLVGREYWGIGTITKAALVFGVMAPPLLTVAGMLLHYLDGRRKKLKVTSSLRNQVVIRFATFGTTLTQVSFFLIGGMIFGDTGLIYKLLINNPLLGLSLSVIFILYGCVSLQLLKEKFHFKIAVS